MEKSLVKIFESAFKSRKEPVEGIPYRSPGPVITISREYGTNGLEIAQKLTHVINERNNRLELPGKEWRYISKEILVNAARELNMTKELADQLSEAIHVDLFSSLTQFMSDDFYSTNTKVKNTIAKIIHSFAVQGHVVIVGRAAEAIVKDIRQSIRVKVAAPLDYRVKVVSETEHLSMSEARKKCHEQDKKRQQFRHYFEGDHPDIEYFDITFNNKNLSDDEIVEMILIVAETRGFI